MELVVAALVPVPRRSSRLADAGGNRKDHVVKKNDGSKRSPHPAGDSPSGSQASAQSSPSLNQCQSPEQSSHSLSSPPKPSPRYSLPSQITSSLLHISQATYLRHDGLPCMT